MISVEHVIYICHRWPRTGLPESVIGRMKQFPLVVRYLGRKHYASDHPQPVAVGSRRGPLRIPAVAETPGGHSHFDRTVSHRR
jgi:hypothetical protein